jgi:hypothetical protein
MRRIGDSFPGGSAAAVVFVEEVPISGAAGGEVAIVMDYTKQNQHHSRCYTTTRTGLHTRPWGVSYRDPFLFTL